MGPVGWEDYPALNEGTIYYTDVRIDGGGNEYLWYNVSYNYNGGRIFMDADPFGTEFGGWYF